MIDWTALYARHYVSAPGCWESCGSYCCGNFHTHTDAPARVGGDAVVIPFFPGEYAHHLALGGLSPGMQVATQHYTLPDGTPWTVRFLRCTARGRCQPHTARPLVCRIYPFFPLVDVAGNILGFEYGALSDLFHGPDSAHPCTLARTRGEAVRRELALALAPALAQPELLFAFGLLGRLTAALRRHLAPALAAAGSQDGDHAAQGFARALDWAVFSRKPWRSPAFVQAVADWQAAVTARYGPLSLEADSPCPC